MGEELMTQNTDTQPEVDPTSPHYQNDPSFIDENQTPEAQEKAILEWQKAAYPGYVKLRSCEEIYDTIYHKRDPIVEGLIDHGTIILGGASKVGKSFLSLQLAYCVSQGLPFLGFKTNQTGVIYFALEDVERRIQHRMQKMFGLEPAKNLYFATEAGYVGGGGFEEQLNTVLHDHPDVGLVIVDVLQKIRNPMEQSSYATDYVFINAVKELADRYGICLILVHHTRKSADSDIFKMLSGSRGITAAVDGSMVLYKTEVPRSDTCRCRSRNPRPRAEPGTRLGLSQVGACGRGGLCEFAKSTRQDFTCRQCFAVRRATSMDRLCRCAGESYWS